MDDELGYAVYTRYDQTGDNQAAPINHATMRSRMQKVVHNLQGDVIAIVDNAGNKVVEYKYDAWGKPIAKTGSLASTLGTLYPFRYRGYVYDEETGLYYLRSRYYTLTRCRFINTDVLLYRVGILFSSNAFLYCMNTPITYTDTNGYEASECEHVFFKNTYYMTGDVFYSYLLWQYSRHPNEGPEPPVIETLKEITGIVGGQAIDELDNWFTKAKKAKEYSFPIIGAFLNYNYAMEGYIVGEVARNCSAPGGYQTVKIELLYGSHSAEVRLTLVDQKSNIVNCNVINTQGYDVILDMMDCMKLLVDEFGGAYYHEGVGWKYTMVE